MPGDKVSTTLYVPWLSGSISKALLAGFQPLKSPAKNRCTLSSFGAGIWAVLKVTFTCPKPKRIWEKPKNAQKKYFFIIINCPSYSYFTGNVPGNVFIKVKLLKV